MFYVIEKWVAIELGIEQNNIGYETANNKQTPLTDWLTGLFTIQMQQMYIHSG